MALLLDDLLDVARITRGRLEIKKERVDLSTLMGSAAKYAPRGGTIRLPRSVVVAQTAPMNSDQASPGTGAEPRARILLADDNRDAADSMAMLLELNGHEVIVAYTGNQALELGRLHAPQAAVLDIGMPDMSGYELARRARKEDWGKDIYLIALTGWGQAEDKEKARAAGFDRHLTKPVDPDRLHELLKTYLESRRV